MKKITLACLAVGCLVGSLRSQANFAIEAPLDNGSTSEFRAPNGSASHAFQRTVMYISPAELSPMSLATINSFSFQLTKGASLAVSGNFTVYMQNTSDVAYNKGLSFSAAVAPMTQVYNSTYVVPASAGASTVGITLSTPFNYNGGGLYVAYQWASTGPFAATSATYACNNTSADIATGDDVAGVPSNTLALAAFRPALLFSAVNTATNEAGILFITAPGKIAKLNNTGHDITALVVNSSIGALTNVAVTLNSTGANAFNSVITVPTLAGGASTLITFGPFNPTANGINTLSVSLAADQNTVNNSMVFTQSVSCNEVAIHPPFTAGSYTSQGYGAGANTSGLVYAMEYLAPAASSLAAVKLVIPSFASAANLGKQIYPVLMDATGQQVATGNTVTITAPMMDVFTSITFPVPPPLTANTLYHLGIAIPINGYFPIGTAPFTNVSVPGYVSIPVGGGAVTQLNFGFLSLEGVLNFPNTQLTASASQTVVCKKDGPGTVTLTVGGAGTYTWSGGVTSNSTTVVVSPSVTGTGGGVVVYNVVGTETVSGCKTTNASITVSVSLCAGLATNNSNGYDLKLFPNPAVNGKSTITGLAGTNVITVFNSLGQVVSTQNVSEESTTIDLSSLPAGNYLVKITDSNSESRTIKVVNQN